MTIVTGVPAPANRDEGGAAESPRGSPEPGLAIVPLGVVPLTAGYLLQATGDLATDGPDATRCPARLQADAEERVGRVADERPARGFRNGQRGVRPGIDHGQRARGVQVI